MISVTIGGRELKARAVTASVMLDLYEQYKNDRELTRHVIAASLVDESGSPALTPEEVERLPWADYARARNATRSVNDPGDDAKKD